MLSTHKQIPIRLVGWSAREKKQDKEQLNASVGALLKEASVALFSATEVQIYR